MLLPSTSSNFVFFARGVIASPITYYPVRADLPPGDQKRLSMVKFLLRVPASRQYRKRTGRVPLQTYPIVARDRIADFVHDFLRRGDLIQVNGVRVDVNVLTIRTVCQNCGRHDEHNQEIWRFYAHCISGPLVDPDHSGRVSRDRLRAEYDKIRTDTVTKVPRTEQDIGD